MVRLWSVDKAYCGTTADHPGHWAPSSPVVCPAGQTTGLSLTTTRPQVRALPRPPWPRSGALGSSHTAARSGPKVQGLYTQPWTREAHRNEKFSQMSGPAVLTRLDVPAWWVERMDDPPAPGPATPWSGLAGSQATSTGRSVGVQVRSVASRRPNTSTSMEAEMADEELHEHDRGLSHDLPTLLSRRRALAWLGGTGLAVALARWASPGTTAPGTPPARPARRPPPPDQRPGVAAPAAGRPGASAGVPC
jgi:hypothetical protein